MYKYTHVCWMFSTRSLKLQSQFPVLIVTSLCCFELLTLLNAVLYLWISSRVWYLLSFHIWIPQGRDISGSSRHKGTLSLGGSPALWRHHNPMWYHNGGRRRWQWATKKGLSPLWPSIPGRRCSQGEDQELELTAKDSKARSRIRALHVCARNDGKVQKHSVNNTNPVPLTL